MKQKRDPQQHPATDSTMSYQEPIVCRDTFYNKLAEHYADHPLLKPWSSDYLHQAIDVMRQIRDNKDFKKTKQHHYLLRRHQLLEKANGEFQVISKPSRKADTPESSDVVFRVVVPYEDVYDKIHDLHVKMGHGRRIKMMTVLRRKYIIPRICCDTFLELCRVCAARKRGDEHSLCSTENVGQELMDASAEDCFNGIGQVDVVDMCDLPDGDFRYILRYEDLGTKFLTLRAMKSNTPAAIAGKLLKIFVQLGPPLILQSGSGGYPLVKAMIGLLRREWPSCSFVNGHRPSYSVTPSQSFSAASQELVKLLQDWMWNKATPNWSKGCHFVQWQKNNTHHLAIDRSPYEATFSATRKLNSRSSTDVNGESEAKPQSSGICEPKNQQPLNKITAVKRTPTPPLVAVDHEMSTTIEMFDPGLTSENLATVELVASEPDQSFVLMEVDGTIEI